jgi:hypothetical protein
VLDLEASALELAEERPQELVPAPRRRRLEVVEEREISTAAARAPQVELDARAPKRSLSHPPSGPDDSGCARHPCRNFHT